MEDNALTDRTEVQTSFVSIRLQRKHLLWLPTIVGGKVRPSIYPIRNFSGY